MEQAELQHLGNIAHFLHKAGHTTLSRHAVRTRGQRAQQLEEQANTHLDACSRCAMIRRYGDNALVTAAGVYCMSCRFLETRPPLKKPSRAACLARQKAHALKHAEAELQAAKSIKLGVSNTKAAGVAQAATAATAAVAAPAVVGGKIKEKNKSKDRKKARQQGLLQALTKAGSSKKASSGSGLGLSDLML